MAEVIYQDPVQEIRGTLTKDGTIHRRKYYRDANGKIIGASKPEAYQILYPRNWKKNPAKGKELEHQLRFKDACAETKRILMAAKYLKAQATQSTNPALPSDYTPTPEDLASLQYWQDRFKPNSKSPNPKHPPIPTQADIRPISASMLSFELAFCERWNPPNRNTLTSQSDHFNEKRVSQMLFLSIYLQMSKKSSNFAAESCKELAIWTLKY